ncbi:MAG: hypothetical protein HMLKMBBP_03873 [Planctomycetes bacterium]|nr:hypothetical protein [Planctomycetota bacterium]
MTRPARALDLVERLDTPLAAAIVALAARVGSHEVFDRLRSMDDVRAFMEHHVWAVWDFMSLLKSIQSALAPATTPWTPSADPESARFVNEIVLGEESDEAPDGGHASHFEIYVAAMDAAGAETKAIRAMTAAVARGVPWQVALAGASPPQAAGVFVASTMETVAATLPERVAAFTLGREDVIPGMFRAAVARLDRADMRGSDLRVFRWYLDRHIAVDADHHAPLAARLFEKTCLTDPATIDVSLQAAVRALRARVALWDAVAMEEVTRAVSHG